MIIKLTRRTARADFDEQPVYINTNYITDFYADYLRINGELILCTTIHLTECTICVAETPEVILNGIRFVTERDDKNDKCWARRIFPEPDIPTIK